MIYNDAFAAASKNPEADIDYFPKTLYIYEVQNLICIRADPGDSGHPEPLSTQRRL